MLKPIERLMRSGLFGPWDGLDVSDDCRRAQPGRHKKWTSRSFQIFPNFTIVFRGAGWYLTYSYWPTSHNTHIFEANLYFTPSRNVRERLAHELSRATHKEYALQDCGTLEATQMGLESRVVSSFPLGDQEVLCRHLNKVVGEWVDGLRASKQRRGDRMSAALLPAEFADLEPFAAKWCLPNEPEPIRSSAGQHHGRDAGVLRRHFPRAEAVIDFLDEFPLDELPEDAGRLLQLMYSLIMVSFPVEIFRQP